MTCPINTDRKAVGNDPERVSEPLFDSLAGNVIDQLALGVRSTTTLVFLLGAAAPGIGFNQDFASTLFLPPLSP
jgi:hypothetical protein